MKTGRKLERDPYVVGNTFNNYFTTVLQVLWALFNESFSKDVSLII